MSGPLRERASRLLQLERELFGAWCQYLFRRLDLGRGGVLQSGGCRLFQDFHGEAWWVQREWVEAESFYQAN